MWKRNTATSLEVTQGVTNAPFLLVFSDAFHPEWEASVNGQQLAHVIVNGISNGWIVPALPQGGKIVLSFAGQRSYAIAAIISLIALIVLCVLAAQPQLWAIRTPDR